MECYDYIYRALFLIYCAHLVSATLPHCSDHAWISIFLGFQTRKLFANKQASFVQKKNCFLSTIATFAWTDKF